MNNGDYLVEIYPRVQAIFAQKRPSHLNCDRECQQNGHRYRHDFKSPARLIGLPDDTELILRPSGLAFEIPDGSMLITDY